MEDRNGKLIIAMDTNAHSQLYGTETNKRGEEMEDIIFSHGLYVENLGTIPTFETTRGGCYMASHVDVTLSRGDIQILGWHVDRGYNASDHNTITWHTKDEQVPGEPIRKWKKAKWEVFTRELEEAIYFVPEEINRKKVDLMLRRLYANLNGALDKA